MLIHSSCRVDPISPQVNFIFYFVLFLPPMHNDNKELFYMVPPNFMTTNPLIVLFVCHVQLYVLSSYSIFLHSRTQNYLHQMLFYVPLFVLQ